MKIGKNTINIDEVIAALESEKTLILATCADNRVTIRPMSHVNEGLAVYFQTGENYLKAQQIRANPNVALYIGTFEIEGIAKILGHPLDEANRFFVEKYKVKQPTAYELYTPIKDQVVVKVEIGLVRRWQYLDDGKPGIAIGRFSSEGKNDSQL